MNEVDLKDVRIFVRVAELGGFAAAARALHIAKSSVSRAIARLEERLGVRLLQRTPRALVLTDAGARYLARVAEAVATIEDASREAAARDTPRGVVRLTAPPDVGSEALPHLIARFTDQHPEVSVEVTLSPAPLDLIEGGFDLALRGGPQPDSALMMSKLLDTAFRLYASPRYLARAGTPAHPAALAQHACVLFHGRRGRSTWTLVGPSGTHAVEVTGRITCDDLAFARRAAVAGAGIALLPEVPGQRAVAAGSLVAVLPDHRTPSDPLFIVSPSARHMPPHVSALRAFLIDAFRTPFNIARPPSDTPPPETI